MIAELDKNIKVENSIGRDDVVWLNIKDIPVDVYGLYDYKNGDKFKRMDEAVAEKVSNGVKLLNYNTAGGRVRFSTDSPYIAIRTVQPPTEVVHNMCAMGQRGFDLFYDGPIKSTCCGPYLPPVDNTKGYESIRFVKGGEMRNYTIVFPSYADVNELYIGVRAGSTVSNGKKYENDKPIVYYGSSITQGGCASKPSNTYQQMISAKYNLDYVNLGFSGNAKGEQAMADYISGMDMSVFVCDYDYNAPSVEHLQNTHKSLYETFRKKQPNTPIIFISIPNFSYDSETQHKRRDIVYSTYHYAINNGDKNAYFINGAQILPQNLRHISTVDGYHPNDIGFLGMANSVGATILEILQK